MHEYSVPRETRQEAGLFPAGSVRIASAQKQYVQLDAYNTRRDYEFSTSGSTYSAYARIRCPLYLHAPCTRSWSAVPSYQSQLPSSGPFVPSARSALAQGPCKTGCVIIQKCWKRLV